MQGATTFHIGPHGITGSLNVEVSRVTLICFTLLLLYFGFLTFVTASVRPSNIEEEYRENVISILYNVGRVREWILLASR